MGFRKPLVCLVQSIDNRTRARNSPRDYTEGDRTKCVAKFVGHGRKKKIIRKLNNKLKYTNQNFCRLDEA